MLREIAFEGELANQAVPWLMSFSYRSTSSQIRPVADGREPAHLIGKDSHETSGYGVLKRRQSQRHCRHGRSRESSKETGREDHVLAALLVARRSCETGMFGKGQQSGIDEEAGITSNPDQIVGQLESLFVERLSALFLVGVCRASTKSSTVDQVCPSIVSGDGDTSILHRSTRGFCTVLPEMMNQLPCLLHDGGVMRGRASRLGQLNGGFSTPSNRFGHPFQ